MIVIPFQVDPRQYSVMVAFDEEGLDRLRKYDPGELVLSKLGPPWTGLKLKDVVITFCNADDLERVKRWCTVGDVKSAYKWLTRGWQFRPDLGDHDRDPESLL